MRRVKTSSPGDARACRSLSSAAGRRAQIRGIHTPRGRRFLPVLSALLVLGAAAHPARSEDWSARDYVTRVLERSPEVGAAKALYDSASGAWKKSIGDSWLPAFSFTGTDHPWGNDPGNSNKHHGWRVNANDMSYNASAKLSLFNSFADARTVRLASLARRKAAVSLDEARQARAFEAWHAWLDLYLRQQLKEVAESDAAAQKTQYELTKDLYRNGMRSRSDLLKSENDWRSAELGLLSAEAEWRKALYQFNVLLDRPGAEPARVANLSPPSVAAMTLEDEARRADSRRLESRRAELDIRSAQVSTAKALQGIFPTLAASFNWDESRTPSYGEAGGGSTRPNWYAMLTLSLPLGFNGWSQVQSYLSARADERKAREERRALSRQVRREVHFARIELEVASESYALSLLREAAAKDNLALVTQQYRQGSADVIRLSQARQDYLQARVERVRFLHGANLRWLEYRRATGENLWEF